MEVASKGNIKCAYCGDIFTPDDLAELKEMGEDFHFEHGCFLCPDCYSHYSSLDLEDQLEFGLNSLQ